MARGMGTGVGEDLGQKIPSTRGTILQRKYNAVSERRKQREKYSTYSRLSDYAVTPVQAGQAAG